MHHFLGYNLNKKVIMIWLLITFVQIVSESFPISSSGHVLLLVQWLQKLKYSIPSIEMVDEITALPTLLVIAFCYRAQIVQALIAAHWYHLIYFWICIGIATLPTIFIYFCIHYWHCKLHLPLWIGFALSALLLFSTKYAPVGSSVCIQSLFIVGITQAIALFFPGLSRMATTYTVACWLGIASSSAFTLSIAFEVPLLCGAFLKIILLHPQWLSLYTCVDWTSTVLIAMAPAMIGLRYMIVLADYHHLWYVSYYLIIPIILSILCK